MPRFNCQNIIEDSGVDFVHLKTINAETHMFLIRHNKPSQDLFFDFFEKFFENCDLVASFEKPCLIIVDENINADVLCNLHLWLINKTCNIKNITMLSLSTLGKAQWYYQWCELHGYQDHAMKIVELPWFYQCNARYFENLPPQPVQRKLPIKWYFSFYGGAASSLLNSILTALVASADLPSYVSYIGGYWKNVEELENLAEVLTGWTDRCTVDKILAVIQKSNIHRTGVKDEIVDFTGLQWQIDQQSAAQIVRESMVASQWYAASEKTLRAFAHQQFVVPISGVGAKDQLSKVGFQFANVVDYDNYQYKNNWFDRCHTVVEQFESIAQKHTLSDFEDILHSNQHILKHNYEYIQSGDLEKFLYNKALKELRNE